MAAPHALSVEGCLLDCAAPAMLVSEWVREHTFSNANFKDTYTSCNKFWCGSFFSVVHTLSHTYSYIYHICYFRIVCLSIFTMYVWICHFWIMLVGWLKMGIIFQKYDYIHAPSTKLSNIATVLWQWKGELEYESKKHCCDSINNSYTWIALI